MNKRKFTIEQARVLGGFTQEEMAGFLGMTAKTYIQHEKYRRIFRMNAAYKFVEATGMDLEEVIFFENGLQKI